MTWQKWSEAECLAYTSRSLKSKIKHLFSMDFPTSKKCWQIRTGYACLRKKIFIALARKCVMTLSVVHRFQNFSHIQQNCNISVWYVDKSSCKNLPMNGIKDFWMAEKCMMIQCMVNPNPQKRMKAWKNFENQWAGITI